MGRKTKLLNKELRDNIIKLISEGNYVKTACLASGIPEQRYYDWLNKADLPGAEHDIYRQFREELKRAEHENIAHNLKNIQSAGDKGLPNSWQASAWILERKYPADYGRRMELEVGPSKVLLALQDKANQLLQDTKLLDEGTS